MEGEEVEGHSLKSRSFEFFICLVKLCSEIPAFNAQAGEWAEQHWFLLLSLSALCDYCPAHTHTHSPDLQRAHTSYIDFYCFNTSLFPKPKPHTNLLNIIKVWFGQFMSHASEEHINCPNKTRCISEANH